MHMSIRLVFFIILIICSVQNPDSLTFTFLGHSFKNWYHIYQLPVFWDRNLDSRAHRTPDLAANPVSAGCPGDCFCPVYQFILQLSSLAPGHHVISQLFFPGKQCCKLQKQCCNLQRQAGVSHTAVVVTSSSGGHRASPCPACRNCPSLLGCLMPTSLGKKPQLLLRSALGPGAILQGRGWVPA